MRRSFLFIALFSVMAIGCDNTIRNIAEQPGPDPIDTTTLSGDVNPVDINTKGFDFLANMRGHWAGTNRVISDDYDWFAFDFRPTSKSMIHAIFEGGSMGNLFNTFFISNYKNTRTIMVRNGGVLNGIYRTSYFVLDSVRNDADGDFYRFIDAEGGTNTMWMELRFTGDSLYYNVYTSRLGLSFPPTRHMTFKGERNDILLATSAANALGYPADAVDLDLTGGFDEQYTYAEEGAKSATFLWQDANGNMSVEDMGQAAGDPFLINDIPYLSYLNLTIEQNSQIEDSYLFVNLSSEPLTSAQGYMVSEEAFNSVLLFPVLDPNTTNFQVTYLHPGDYYITVIADANNDGYPSFGDITHPSVKVTIDPETEHDLEIKNINVKN